MCIPAWGLGGSFLEEEEKEEEEGARKGPLGKIAGCVEQEPAGSKAELDLAHPLVKPLGGSLLSSGKSRSCDVVYSTWASPTLCLLKDWSTTYTFFFFFFQNLAFAEGAFLYLFPFP